MIEGIPKISVLIICYKQEELIKRAINSLLAQKDYIYEICVSDDCSPDRTWEVLQEYDRQYPGLFKLHRNEPNVGIFENVEYTWTMPTGDIVYSLAGDDECGEGWFKTVVEYIQKNDIDYKNELFCIYGDYLTVYPNGDSIREKNNLISKGYDPLKLALRGLISNRSSCFSINVLRKYIKVSQGRSHIAEDAQDRQLQLFSQKNYYIPHIGNIYYAKVGVSIHIDQSVFEERAQIHNYSIDFLKSQGVTFDIEDEKHLNRLNIYGVMEKPDHTIWDIIKAFWGSYEKKYGLRSLKLRNLMFAVARRLPHKKAIHW